MIKVSVIVPVYNGEKHLKQCMDSICGQTLKDIEIICVDDGSTDASLEILQTYQQEDPRIRIYTQKHCYAGAARNLGKAHATGEYLAFWDCDDFFEHNALELMYQQAKKTDADICVCGANRWFEDIGQLAPNVGTYLKMKYVPEEVFNRFNNERYLFNFTGAVPWNKLYRQEFIERIGLDFQAVRNGNDIYFTQCAFGLADRITTVNKALVNYRINQDTSLVGTTSKSPFTLFQAWIAVRERLEQSISVPEQSLENRIIENIVHTLRNISDAQAFAESFDYLRNGALEQLQIKVRGADFYYTPWHHQFVIHLLHDSLEEFRQYLMVTTYNQLKDADRKNQAFLNSYNTFLDSYNSFRNSHAYKVMNIIMWLPRKLKKIFSKH